MIKYVHLIFFLLVFIGCEKDLKKINDDGISLSKAMGETDGKFEKAIEKRKFTFPEDHGAHPDFRTEWWYFTGNLDSKNGRKFGYQFTVFRTGLTLKNEDRNSDWSSNQIYMGHLALTDITQDKFYFDERFSRGGNNLAGAENNPLKIWIEDWQIEQTGSETKFDLPHLVLNGKTQNINIKLELEATKPIVLQGDEGLSQKGPGKGNASYYYSYTRLKTVGSVKIEDEIFNVNGFSWLDREWSTSALAEDQIGWDWFALQLSDNSEIMFYQMRKKDGSADIYSKGTIVNPDGRADKLSLDDVVLEVSNFWESPRENRFPSGWILKIPKKKIELSIVPEVKNQFLDVSVKYWEGSVNIEGSKEGEKINGRGYVELTGY